MSGPALRLPVGFLPPNTRSAASWRTRRAGNARWTIRRDAAEELFDEDGLRWNAWKESEALEVIKTGPHRTVYRLHLASGDFYLKHFRVGDWKAWLRNSLRASPAERELRAALRIAALRLPTFEPIALGVSRPLVVTGDTYLVSRAIPGSIPLDHFLLTEFAGGDPRGRAELRQRLARELGRLVARLHRAGVEHVDLHAGNLLIRPRASANEPLVSLIDLHAVRFHPSLSQARRDRNLLALHQFFAGRSTRSDRHRFWLAYAAELSPATPNIPTRSVSEEVRFGPLRAPSLALRVGMLILGLPHRVLKAVRSKLFGDRLDIADRATHCARLERLLERAARAGWRRADRAWKRGNRHVRRLDEKSIRSRGLASLDPAWFIRLRGTPEQPFEQHCVRWCKQSARHRVAEVAFPALGSASQARLPVVHAYWKCVIESGAGVVWRFRYSPARRAWETGHALLRRGIDTPRPMMCVETPAALTRRSYLLTEAIENSTTLTEFFRRRWPGMGDQRAPWLNAHSRRLARQMRGLHESGFDHRDLKFPNLLVSTDETDDRTWLLDLDAVRRWPALPRLRAIQNLSRLNVSSLLVEDFRSTDRLRFLRWYLGPSLAEDWKLWWRRIAARSLRKIDENHLGSLSLS